MESSKQKILIVDDEDFIRKLGKKILTNAGYSIFAAENGTRALEIFKSKADEIALVILDIHMPDMSGFEVYRNLVRMNKETKVLLCSGYLEDMVMEQTKAFFIQKPFTITGFLEMVKTVLNAGVEEVIEKNMHFYRRGELDD